MLAMSDKHGHVQASIPGLAKIAAVTLEETERAINLFLSPDKYSRTKDHEGRRIQEMDGGWLLINHGKYRDELDAEMRRENNRNYKRDERQRKQGKQEPDVIPINRPAPAPESPAKASAESDVRVDLRIFYESIGCFDMREQGALKQVVESHAKHSGKTTLDAMKALTDAWNAYTKAEQEKQFTINVYVSAYKFFMSGKWDKPESWPWDSRQAPKAGAQTGYNPETAPISQDVADTVLMGILQKQRERGTISQPDRKTLERLEKERGAA